jgi:hypothetical protein
MSEAMMTKHVGWLVALVLAAGCSSGNRPVPVQGAIHLDGKPLAGATVTFVPDGPGAKEAHAYSLAEGVFKLSAMPGEYKVLVTYTEPTYDLPPNATQEEAMRAMEKAAKARKQPLLVLPEEYTNSAKTKLRQKVPPDGPVKFELNSKGS